MFHIRISKTPIANHSNRKAALDSNLKDTEEKNKIYLKSRNVNKSPLGFLFTKSILLKTDTNFAQRSNKLKKAYNLLNLHKSPVSDNFRLTRMFKTKQNWRQPYSSKLNKQSIIEIKKDENEKRNLDENNLTMYQLFKMKQQKKLLLSKTNAQNKIGSKAQKTTISYQKYKWNESRIVSQQLKAKEVTLEIPKLSIESKRSKVNKNQINNNTNSNTSNKNSIKPKVKNKDNDQENKDNIDNNNDNGNENTKENENNPDLPPEEKVEEIDPLAGYDQFCTSDFNEKKEEEEDEEDQSIQEFSKPIKRHEEPLETEPRDGNDKSIHEFLSSKDVNSHADDTSRGNTRNAQRDGSKRLPTISMKNRMMLKMKSIASKRQNRQILVPISTLLDFSAKAALGSKDIVIKDFHGTIYSQKASQSSFLFSNTHHSFFIEQNIFEYDNFFLFGVFECEGSEGYQIATIAKLNFIYFFSSEVIYNKHRRPTEEDIYNKLHENNHHLVKLAFEKIVNDINLTRYNSETSGISLSIAIVIGKKLICASVGMIKPIAMIHKDDNGCEYLNAFEFSSFHSFSTEGEKQRVEEATRGKVTYQESTNDYQLEVGFSKQVRMKLTRALGLKEYAKYGLIHEPEINEISLEHSCKCLLMANKTLYDTLGSTFIMKMLCLGMTQKKPISDTSIKILNSYKKRLQSSPSSSIVVDTDCVYLIVYF